MSKITNLIFHNEKHEITGQFGPRKPIQTKYGLTSNFHKGTDYGTFLKKIPQYAVEKGIILSTGYTDGCGNYVWIKYPRLDVKMCHYHLDKIFVKAGQNVDNNTLIGNTGTTGMSTGIHMHLGIFDLTTNEYVDPEIFNYEAKDFRVVPIEQPLFEIGDKVIINGDLYLTSVDSKPNGQVKNKITYITRYNKDGNHPYNTTGDYGWMDESDIKLYVEHATETIDNEITYTVVKGDNLWNIAEKHGTTVNKIYQDNKDIIGSNPRLIYAGQKLIIKK